jgi:hypothetical protein
MIRSCKIRTRPIVITALALVAGSSVIITDPIFQGMAISLLSGVLVSTVLTLIVIPLGCVAAGDDMCRVALATAPSGTSLPCMTDTEPAKSPRRSSGGGVSRLFGKLVEFFVLALYAVRGIFLLIFDAAKNAYTTKRRSGTRRSAARPASPGAASLAAVSEDEPVIAGQRVSATPRDKSASKAATKKSSAKASPAGKDDAPTDKSSQGVQKKAPRRGIRLKIEDESDSGDR